MIRRLTNNFMIYRLLILISYILAYFDRLVRNDWKEKRRKKESRIIILDLVIYRRQRSQPKMEKKKKLSSSWIFREKKTFLSLFRLILIYVLFIHAIKWTNFFFPSSFPNDAWRGDVKKIEAVIILRINFSSKFLHGLNNLGCQSIWLSFL